ncbi:MAG: hypothetical protein KIT34_12520 [Cyanobacteria bacterium TGS_CYA1]|nr:hypothetical protein [Cyanobacteria bacterium TGS_CYA1]
MSQNTVSEPEEIALYSCKQDGVCNKSIAWYKSYTVWLSLMFFASALALSQINYYKIFPSTRISPAMHTRAACQFKIDEWNALARAKKPVDLVVVGSSLPMCCLYYADSEKDAATFLKIKEKGLQLLQAYTAANYFEKKIEQQTLAKAKVFNATVAASMISDNQLLIEKLMNNPPKKIILAVGLRDFADNVNVSYAGTPVFQTLLDLPYLANRDNFAFLIQNAKNSTLEELITCKSMPLYMIHSELGTWLSEETEKLLDGTKKSKTEIEFAKDETKVSNTQATTANFKNGSTDAAIKVKPVALDQLDYKQRYMPANYKQLELEQKCLERVCELCKDKEVELILVNTPVSSHHHTLSSKDLRQKYLNGLQNVSTKYGVKYIDFENKNLIPDQDFLDTVHMGPPGAVKFIDYLVGECGIFRN